jgi:hypothetical protein
VSSSAHQPIYVWAALPVVHLLGARARLRAVLRGIAVRLIAVVPIADFNYYFYAFTLHPSFRAFRGGHRRDERGPAAGHGWTGYLLADTSAPRARDAAFLSRAWDAHSRCRRLADVPRAGARARRAVHVEPWASARRRQSNGLSGSKLVEHRDPPPRTWCSEPPGGRSSAGG